MLDDAGIGAREASGDGGLGLVELVTGTISPP